MTAQASESSQPGNGSTPSTPAPTQAPALALVPKSAAVEAWELLQRKATALASCTFVPPAFQKNVPNCIIAVEIADRVGLPVIMVCQNLHVINGRPGWSSVFLIGSVNSSGRFTPLRFEWKGKEGSDDWACRAVSTDVKTGERLEGTWIDWRMVRLEKWADKDGSKWKSMPEQMFRYRAGAFWARTYCPEIALGLLTEEEIKDMNAIVVPAEVAPGDNQSLEEALRTAGAVPHDDDGVIIETTPPESGK